MDTSEIWGSISAGQAHEILLCVQENHKKLYRTALEVLGKQMKLRPARVLELPKVERHAAWAKILSQGHLEPLSFNLISHWLIHAHSPLLVAWLDALGFPHDGKGVADTFAPCPAPEKLKAALDQVLEKFAAKVVAIYLRAFNEIDGVRWPALAELLRTDARLKLS